MLILLAGPTTSKNQPSVAAIGFSYSIHWSACFRELGAPGKVIFEFPSPSSAHPCASIWCGFASHGDVRLTMSVNVTEGWDLQNVSSVVRPW
jgi:hypothetical protein